MVVEYAWNDRGQCVWSCCDSQSRQRLFRQLLLMLQRRVSDINRYRQHNAVTDQNSPSPFISQCTEHPLMAPVFLLMLSEKG